MVCEAVQQVLHDSNLAFAAVQHRAVHTGDGTGRSRPGAPVQPLRGADRPLAARSVIMRNVWATGCGGGSARQVKAHGGQLRPAGDAELGEDAVKMAAHGAM
jgi:hypothetical protein